jgi:hypothetical protein
MEERCLLAGMIDGIRVATPDGHYADFVAGISSEGTLAELPRPSEFAPTWIMYVDHWTLDYTTLGTEHSTGEFETGQHLVDASGSPWVVSLTQTFPDAGVHGGVAHVTGDVWDTATVGKPVHLGTRTFNISFNFYVAPAPQTIPVSGSLYPRIDFVDVPASQQTPLGGGKHALKSWKAQALLDAQTMFRDMPPAVRHPFLVLLPGEVKGVESMTVIPLNHAGGVELNPDALVQAASQLGFWVEANGVQIAGQSSGGASLTVKGSVTVYLIDSWVGTPPHFTFSRKQGPGARLHGLSKVIWPVLRSYGSLVKAPHLELYLRPGAPPQPLFPPGSTWLEGFADTYHPDN